VAKISIKEQFIPYHAGEVAIDDMCKDLNYEI